jgi:hypothetical protein
MAVYVSEPELRARRAGGPVSLREIADTCGSPKQNTVGIESLAHARRPAKPLIIERTWVADRQARRAVLGLPRALPAAQPGGRR